MLRRLHPPSDYSCALTRSRLDRIDPDHTLISLQRAVWIFDPVEEGAMSTCPRGS
jgi:hypothetical protein